MKKIVVLTALLMLFTGTCFAATETLTAAGGITSADGMMIKGGSDATIAASNTGVVIGKLSKGVKLSVNHTTTGYAIMTKHAQGSKAYGTAHDATAIYTTEVGTGDLTLKPSNPDYSSFSSWTAM